jgi:hypothetical protein
MLEVKDQVTVEKMSWVMVEGLTLALYTSSAISRLWLDTTTT